MKQVISAHEIYKVNERMDDYTLATGYFQLN